MQLEYKFCKVLPLPHFPKHTEIFQRRKFQGRSAAENCFVDEEGSCVLDDGVLAYAEVKRGAPSEVYGRIFKAEFSRQKK